MHYRLVYDVLHEGFPWFGLLFASVPVLLAIAYLLEIVDRVRGKAQSPGPRIFRGFAGAAMTLPAAIVSFAILAVAGAFITWRVWNALVQRKECQGWVRTGQFQVTEGTVTDYEFRKAGPSFRVGGLSFDLSQNDAGFTGRFNIPREREGYLWDGMPVRLAHRNGRIMRVEIESAK